MTSRERLLTSIAFKAPDRLPEDRGGMLSTEDQCRLAPLDENTRATLDAAREFGEY